MRHGKRFNHLSRKAPHRKSMLSNMASSLIIHKKIETTVAKAKALRKYVEPLLTKSKSDTTHSRRSVFSHLQNKESVSELFNNISEKISLRPGGYTRIIKTGNRLDTVLILSLGTFIKIYFDCLARRTEFILKISLFNISFFDISNDLELHKTA